MSAITRALYLAVITLGLSGCVTERVIEKPVPAKIPSLCLTACPYSTDKPVTNGDLALQWRERGEALVCYESRMACVRELTSP